MEKISATIGRLPSAGFWGLLCLEISFGVISPAKASTYTWTPTAAGTGYNWNAGASNWTSGFPNAAGDLVNLNNDILGAQTVRLRQNITLGALNIGDASAAGNSFGFTVANATSPLEAFSLIFDNGPAAAQINTTGSGTPTNTISTPITLNSDLSVNIGGSDFLTLSGAIATNNHPISFSGGVSGVNSVSLSGDITGNGVITNNSNMAVSFSGAKSFTGTLVANKGMGGSNTGTFTLITGSLGNATEFVINGYLTGNVQNGGSIHLGNGSGQATNPGQRLTTGTVTLNGGTLRDFGQAATVGLVNDWQKGLEKVTDTVAVLSFNNGYSHVNLAAGSNTAGTILNVTALQRGAGGTGFVSSSGLSLTSQLLAGNSASFLLGAGGAEGTTTMSIIPWLAAINDNGSSQSPNGIVTNSSHGLRALASAEYGLSISSGSTSNVSVNALTMAAPTTVNSLRFTLASISNITDSQTTGTGQTLTVSSGGVFFSNTGGTIGGTGSPRAGTLHFGAAEGVVWANGTNTNTIGAVITGSGGLTKTGSGTLILSGANTYGGTTIVSGGNLQVGIGGVGQTGADGILLNARGTVLSGTGTVRGPTMITFGQIRPGDTGGAGAGTLTTQGNLTFNPADPAPSAAVTTVADFKILDATTADKIIINGDLTLNSKSRLVVGFDPGYTPTVGDAWSLLDWTGLLTLNGFSTGSNLRDGSGDDGTNLDLPTLTGGNLWDISNFSGSGSLTITIVSVPEPSRLLLIFAGLSCFVVGRKRSNLDVFKSGVS
ncbi:MAG: hypothetical protein RL693_1971 [Verrucomicrobiota bacterium]